MVFGSPPQRNREAGMSLETATDHAVEVLSAALPTMEQLGVTLALEPLAPNETDFMTTASETVALIDRLDSLACRLHLDVKAMASEQESAAELIRRYAPYLAHFHANDPNLQGPGFGAEDFVPIFKALQEVNYQGWVSVEVFDYDPGIERLVQESIVYMERILGEIHECAAECGSVHRFDAQRCQMMRRTDQTLPVLLDILGRPANLCNDFVNFFGGHHFNGVPGAYGKLVGIRLLLGYVDAHFTTHTTLQVNFAPLFRTLHQAPRISRV